MALTVSVLLCFAVLALIFRQGFGVDIPIVELSGISPNEDFLRVGASGFQYEAVCRYRVGYDDQVLAVSWLLYGRVVYKWQLETNSVTVNVPLRGIVDPSPARHPQHLHIVAPQLSMTGDYTCRITTVKGDAASELLQINVISVGREEYTMNVDILRDVMENSTSTTTSSTDLSPFAVSSTTTSSQYWIPTGPGKPGPGCILVWSFLTSAIAPRPNVTCGIYSHTLDDVTVPLPGGLMLTQLGTGAWQAEIDHTNIPVTAIPLYGRLGCSVTIPHTNYKKIVKFEDGFKVDNLVDSGGCPSLLEVTQLHGLLLNVQGATDTCRGDLMSSSIMEPVLATVSCPSTALIGGGETQRNWERVLTCSSGDTQWRLVTDPSLLRISYQVSGLQGSQGDGGDPLLVNRGDERSREPFDPDTFLWPTCIGGGLNTAPEHHHSMRAWWWWWLTALHLLLLLVPSTPLVS